MWRSTSEFFISFTRQTVRAGFFIFVGGAAALVTFWSLLTDSSEELEALRQQELKLALVTAVTRAVEEANTRFDGPDIDASFTVPGGGAAEVDFFEVDAKVYFRKGKHSFEDDYRSSKIAFAAFEFVRYMRAGDVRIDRNIRGHFTGSADGKKINGRVNVPFEGTPTVLEHVTVNGEYHSRFDLGGQMNNAELALARAYSVFTAFASQIEAEGLWIDNISFEAITHDVIDPELRYAVMKVTVFTGGTGV